MLDKWFRAAIFCSERTTIFKRYTEYFVIFAIASKAKTKIEHLRWYLILNFLNLNFQNDDTEQLIIYTELCTDQLSLF